MPCQLRYSARPTPSRPAQQQVRLLSVTKAISFVHALCSMLPCLLTCSAVTSLGVLFVQVRAVADTGHAASTGPNAAHRRVVVTGMGVVSCLGHDIDTFYDNLLEVTHHTTYMLGNMEVLIHIH